MAKNYPTILIDRNRREKSTTREHDYIVCLDSECGFVARAQVLSRTDFEVIHDSLSKVEGADVMVEFQAFRNSTKGIAIIIEEMLHEIELSAQTQERIKSLMKRCMKKYLHSDTFGDLTPPVTPKPTTPFSDFWMADNSLCPEHEGCEAIIKTSEPSVLIKFAIADVATSFDDFSKSINQVCWLGEVPHATTQRKVLFDAWNYLSLEEANLGEDTDDGEDDLYI